MPFRVVPARDRLLNRLIKRAPVRTAARGEVVVQAGEAAIHAILVRHGHLHQETAPSGGDETRGRVVDLVLAWELAGMDAVQTDVPHRWSLVADEPSEVQLLKGADVRRVLRRAEGTFDAWQGSVHQRLELLRVLGPGGRAPASRRLGHVLVHLAGRASGGGPDLELPVRVTHEVLGEMAGLHRSTVTTILNDWLYEGLLETLERGWRLSAPRALME